MDVEKVVKELKSKYPGKNIIINTPEYPMEIVCEIEPGDINPDRSIAIAVLDKNIKHCHRIAKEKYEVLKGELEISKAGRSYFLHEGGKIVVEPGEYHIAKGKETWVKVTSTPAWTPEDQLPIEESTKFSV